MAGWCEARGLGLDGQVAVNQLAALARRWYRDRMAADWQPRDRTASQAILTAVGLTGAHWTLPG